MNDIVEIADPEKVEKVLVSHLKANDVYTDGPQLWTIRYSELNGRGMFATRDIKPGELIYVDAPLVIGPRYTKELQPICVSCYKTNCPLFPCDRGCGLPICSVDCENSPKHVNYECEYLQSLVPTCGSDWCFDLLLTVTMIRGLFMTDQQRECLATFQYHQNISPAYEVELLQRNVKNRVSAEDLKFLTRICGAFNTNSFETVVVDDKGKSTSLRGLYPMGALQNHACVPKTRHHFDGKHRLCVSAALPISAGEELTMTYTSLFWDTPLRRQFLSVTKHFLCCCSRCRDPTEFGTKLAALLCASENCPGTVLPRDPLNLRSPWTCSECEVTINYRQINSIRLGLSSIMKEALYEPPREILRFMQKDLSALLPENNYLITNTKFRIISYFGRTDDLGWADLTDIELTQKWTYCNELLSILDALGCGDCTKRGLILYELYCTHVEMLKRLRQQSNGNSEKLRFPIKVNAEENERILEKSRDILQNDILAITTLQHDKEIQ